VRVTEQISPPFVAGGVVRVRGRQWTVSAVDRGVDCQAVGLRPDDESAGLSTLLSPYDRFRPVSHAPVATVSLPVWLDAMRSHLAGLRPPGGLTAAVRSQIRLLPFQLDPALAMWRHGVARVLIADAVGLGKTVQAGLVISELCARSVMARVLVLVPAGLREQWAEELRRHFGLDTQAADATWLVTAGRDRPSTFNLWSPPGVYIASHDFVKRPEVFRPLEEVTWDLLVLDEAHAAACHTDRRTAADALARRSRRVLLLTATPHGDDPPQFEALCRIGDLDEGRSPILIFRRTRQDVGDGRPRRSRLHLVQPSVAEHGLHEMLDRYTRQIWQESAQRGDDTARLVVILLRKRALSSAGSLLISIRRRSELLLGRHDPLAGQLRLPLLSSADEDPLGDQADDTVMGTPGMSDARREQRWLAALAEVAHRATRAETKPRYLTRLLRRAGEPAIVFTEYRDTLHTLERLCARADIETVSLHGALSPVERGRVRRRFNEVPCTLLATDAAAEGLNLHARCRLVVHYELPWSLARLEQRAGRVDRFGQTRLVHEIGLVAANTAEGLVLAPLAARASLARRTGTLNEGLATSFTEPRVATLVMSGRRGAWTPPPPTAISLPATAPAPASDAAIEEARRLTGLRSLERRPPAQLASRSYTTVATRVTRRRARLKPGIYSVYRIALVTSDGRTVSVHACVVHRAFKAGESRPVTTRALRQAVMGHTGIDLATLKTLWTVTSSALAGASEHLSAVTATLARRERQLQLARSAASRQLVQAGLFDRRAMRDAERRREVDHSLEEESELRLRLAAPMPIVGIDIRLVAIVHVGPGER
jgi:superfamily II DNA or RNA helicase